MTSLCLKEKDFTLFLLKQKPGFELLRHCLSLVERSVVEGWKVDPEAGIQGHSVYLGGARNVG